MDADSGNSGAQRATLRVPVELDARAVELVRLRLNALTGSDVVLETILDPTVEGAVLQVGRSTRVTIDLADLVGPTGPLAKVGESGLWRLLQRMGNSAAVLESRSPLAETLVEATRIRLSEAAGHDVNVDTLVNPALETTALLHLGPDASVDLDLNEQLLKALDVELAHREPARTRSLQSTREYLSEVVARIRPTMRVSDTSGKGFVEQVGDGIAIVRGLAHVGSQEVVQFETGPFGIAFNLLRDATGCIMLGSEDLVDVGTGVERTGKLLEVPVGSALVGRMVNALGQPIDGRGPVPLDDMRQVERVAPGVVRRRPVAEPLHTGIKVLDALVPLGRGQRELILGDRKIGKTTIAIDTILSQQASDVVCIYAAIGQKASSVARVVRVLEEHGAMDYTVLVVAFPNEEPAFRYLVPYTACAIAEQVMDRGGHALVIYDDLSKHAVTYREISALLRRPIGREAYPGDIFYIHSRLLERAAKLRDDLGGGSVTALPIVETLAGDISAFIPTNAISICDGQVMLDAGLFNEGFRPPMDAGLSVSRVGGMAQTPAMKKVAGRLRIDLAQYDEMAQFVKFGAEVDQATLDQLIRGERERELLKQDQHAPLRLEQEVAILYAAVNGFADPVPLSEIHRFEQEFLALLEVRYPFVLAVIRDTKDLAPATEEALAGAATQFVRDFLTAPSPVPALK